LKQNVTEENANRDTAIKKLLLKMENCEEYNAERTIPTPSHLKSSVWKHFGFYTVGGKVTNKDKARMEAFWLLHRGWKSHKQRQGRLSSL
jgi:hypothetical protein